MRVGDPLDMATAIGAVNSEIQLNQNLGFVETAVTEGGEVALGGTRILQDTGGYYMAPTIVTGVTPEATLDPERGLWTCVRCDAIHFG